MLFFKKTKTNKFLKLGRILPLIVELAQFVDRVNTVFLNGVRQFASLYHEQQALYRASFSHIHLRAPIEALGRLLVILVTLDEIAGRNEALELAWQKYKSTWLFLKKRFCFSTPLSSVFLLSFQDINEWHVLLVSNHNSTD